VGNDGLKILIFGIKVKNEVALNEVALVQLDYYADFSLKYSILVGNLQDNISGSSKRDHPVSVF